MKSRRGLIELAVAFVMTLALALAPLACGSKTGARRAVVADRTPPAERGATAEPKPHEPEDPGSGSPATAGPRPGPR